MASHLPSLHQVTQHHQHSTLPVIDHLPEISGSGLHGTLSYDEGSLLLVALGGFAATTQTSSFLAMLHGLRLRLLTLMKTALM